MKKKFSRVAVITLIITLFCTSVSFGGEYCTMIKGTGGASKSFVVKTGKKLLTSDYVKITQKKGKLKHTKGLTNSKMGEYKTSSKYGYYVVSIYDYKTKKTKEKVFKGKTVKLSLKKDRKYKITVTPQKLNYANAMLYYMKETGGFPEKWTRYSSWSVTKTKNISSCK